MFHDFLLGFSCVRVFWRQMPFYTLPLFLGRSNLLLGFLGKILYIFAFFLARSQTFSIFWADIRLVGKTLDFFGFLTRSYSSWQSLILVVFSGKNLDYLSFLARSNTHLGKFLNSFGLLALSNIFL